MAEPMDPHKTIIVIKKNGREVGRVPAAARNANEYITEMTRLHGSEGITCDYERDPTDGLAASLFGPPRRNY